MYIAPEPRARLLNSVASPERDYFDTVLDVLSMLDCDATETAGFSCLLLVDGSTITLADGRAIGPRQNNPGPLGMIGDIAQPIAVAFHTVSALPSFWKARYSEMG